MNTARLIDFFHRDNGGLELTPDVTSRTGSAFHNSPFDIQNNRFVARFEMWISGDAEGMTFAVLDDTALDMSPSFVGTGGSGLGWGGASGFAVEFDIAQNDGDLNDNHVGVNVDGSLFSVATDMEAGGDGFDLATGTVAGGSPQNVYVVEVQFDSGHIVVIMSGGTLAGPTTMIDTFIAPFASTQALFGFTAATGADESAQFVVDNFTLELFSDISDAPVACCGLADGSCGLQDAESCAAAGGVEVEACLGDRNENDINDACEPPELVAIAENMGRKSTEFVSPHSENVAMAGVPLEATEALTLLRATVEASDDPAPARTAELTHVDGGMHTLTIDPPVAVQHQVRITLEVESAVTGAPAMFVVLVGHLPGDVDQSGKVGISDVAQFGIEWRKIPPPLILLDHDGDNRLSAGDPGAFGATFSGFLGSRQWNGLRLIEVPKNL